MDINLLDVMYPPSPLKTRCVLGARHRCCCDSDVILNVQETLKDTSITAGTEDLPWPDDKGRGRGHYEC